MKVLVIGLGRIGALHAAHLGLDPRVERLLLLDPDHTRRESVCGSLRRARPVPALEDALAAGIDAAVVAAPSETHFDYVARLLEADVAVFCEKPLALSCAEVASLGAKAGATPLMVGFQRRFDDAYRRLQEASLAARESGCPPTLYRLATGDPLPPPASYLAVAGSIFHDMLIHDFDLLSFMSPEPVVAVGARASAAALQDGAPGWGTAVAVCELADGSVALVAGSRHTGSGYEVTGQVTSPCGTFGIGMAVENAPYDHLDLARRTETCCWPSFLERFRVAYRRELAHFVDVVAGEPLEGAGATEMLRALALADAAERSASNSGLTLAVELEELEAIGAGGAMA